MTMTEKPWSKCGVANTRTWGEHGGKQMCSRRYFTCGCDDGMCEKHAKVSTLGGPPYIPGEAKQCPRHAMEAK